MKLNESVKILKQFEEESGIHFCSDHYGKMQGLFSLSTSPLDNPFCVSRSKQPLLPEELEGYPIVCRDCYSSNLYKRRKTNDDCGRKNARILNERILDVNEWPSVNQKDFPYGRIEAFGETKSWIQQANYFQFAAHNPQIRIADWTKNPRFVEEAIEHGYAVPDNVEMVMSSMRENRPDDPSRYPFFTKVFTVYSLAWLEKNKKEPDFINCGGRSCLGCGLCYRPVNPEDKGVQIINGRPVLFVNELRKQDHKKAEKLGYIIS